MVSCSYSLSWFFFSCHIAFPIAINRQSSKFTGDFIHLEPLTYHGGFHSSKSFLSRRFAPHIKWSSTLTGSFLVLTGQESTLNMDCYNTTKSQNHNRAFIGLDIIRFIVGFYIYLYWINGIELSLLICYQSI